MLPHKLNTKLTLLLVFASTVALSHPTNRTEDMEIPKPRQERAAVSGKSIDWFDVYARLKAIPTLGAYIKDLSVATFNAIGWLTMTTLWTLSGFSSQQETIFSYDFIGRIYRHFSDPAEAAFRIAVNTGVQIFNSFLLLWLSFKDREAPGVLTSLMSNSLAQPLEDKLDFCDNNDSIFEYVYCSFEFEFRFPTALIWAGNNALAIVASLIYWTFLGSLPDPQIIVEGFEN